MLQRLVTLSTKTVALSLEFSPTFTKALFLTVYTHEVDVLIKTHVIGSEFFALFTLFHYSAPL